MEFVEGIAGAGKTTYALNRLEKWLAEGVPPHQILVLVPQQAVALPYHLLLAQQDLPNALDVAVLTYTALAQRALNLYWNQLAPQVIPNWDGRPPTYLTIETAQYYMAQFVEPVLQQGRFDAVSLDRPRLTAQILANLSSAAVNGFSLPETLERLTSSWTGQSSRLGVYEAALEVAQAFRQHCLENALMDFSLQVDLFTQSLLPNPTVTADLKNNFRYLIADNVEENFPVALDFINWLWGSLQDALLVYDRDGGYRVFLGAAPKAAYKLKQRCEVVTPLMQPYQQTAALTHLATNFEQILTSDESPTLADYETKPTTGFTLQFETFYPQMLDWVADKVIDLVKQGVAPGQIAILAPFLGDSLRFSLFNQLSAAQIPFASYRPSRAIRDEPAARAILTFMRLAYQAAPPSRSDFARMLVQFIAGLDAIRAELLAQIVYRYPTLELGSFDLIKTEMQERITYAVGERYETLRSWLAEVQVAETPPDHFIRRLFDQVSQEGYGFHTNLDAGRVVSQLINSAFQFRSVLPAQDWQALTNSFISLVGDGLLASAHTNLPQGYEDAVFVAPAYTFLMRNRVVDYQIWVDVGSSAWFDRIEQPLTHPYVLQRDYPLGQLWTDESEYSTQNDVLRRLLLGLTRRCRQHLYVGLADLGEQGYEQRGILLRMFNQILSFYG